MTGPRTPQQQAAEMARSLRSLGNGLAQRSAISREQLQGLSRLAGDIERSYNSPVFSDCVRSARSAIEHLMQGAPQYQGAFVNTLKVLQVADLSGSQRFVGRIPQQYPGMPQIPQAPGPPRQTTRPATLPDPATHLPGMGQQGRHPQGPGHTIPDQSMRLGQHPMHPGAQAPLNGFRAPLPQAPIKADGESTAALNPLGSPQQRGPGHTVPVWSGDQPPVRTDQGRPGALIPNAPDQSFGDLPSLGGTGFALASESGQSQMPHGLASGSLPDLSLPDIASVEAIPVDSEDIDPLPDISMAPAGATFYGGKSGSIGAEDQRKKTAERHRPAFFTRLYAVAEQVLKREADHSELHEIMQSMGILDLRQDSQVWKFLQYIDQSPYYDYEEELIINEFRRLINSTRNKGRPGEGGDGDDQLEIPPKYANLHQKMRLGVVGWHLREDIKTKDIEFIRFLSAGGMGSVLLAHELTTDRDVAVKIITSGGRDTKREARLGAMFQPGDKAVQVYSGGVVSGYPYIVMPFLGNVRDLHDLEKSLKLPTRLVLCLKMLESIVKMHERGVLHRDIKPPNFLALNLGNGVLKKLLEKMQVYSTDFGLARTMDEPDSGRILGTPRFMPPEQAYGNPLSEKADVYALGISMYNILTNAYPMPKEIWNDGGELVTYARRLQGSAIQDTDRRLLRKGIPHHIVDLLVAMTDADPDNRPTAAEALEIFKPYIESLLPENQEIQRQKKSHERLRNVGVPALIAFILALASGIAYKLSNERPEPHIEHGGMRKNNLSTLLEQLQNSQLTPAQLRTFIRTYRRADWLDEGEADDGNTGKDIPEGYTVDTEAGEPTNADYDALLDAAEMILDGDELLNATPPNFDGARQKYRAGLAKSDRVDEIVTERLERVDRAEVRLSYTTGLRAYRMGNVDDARTHFARCGALENAGLTRTEREGVRAREEILRGWRDLFGEIRQAVDQIANSENFDEEVSTLKSNSLEGDASSSLKLILLHQYLRNHRPQCLIQELANGHSPEQAIRHVRNNPEMINHLRRKSMIDTLCFDVVQEFNPQQIHLPSTILLYQAFLVREITLQQSRIQAYIRSENYQLATSEMEKMISFHLNILTLSSAQYGDLTEVTGQSSLSGYSNSVVERNLRNLQDTLPLPLKRSFRNDVHQEFSGNQEIIELVDSILSLR